jgi:hypothetical protein
MTVFEKKEKAYSFVSTGVFTDTRKLKSNSEGNTGNNLSLDPIWPELKKHKKNNSEDDSAIFFQFIL